MPINLQGSGNIAEGWGPAPHLEAPSIGSLVSAILQNRQYQQEATHRDIADAIKQFQQQRESRAYLDAAQKAGLLPEGDYGGLGLKGGESVAELIQKQKAQQSLDTYHAALAGEAGAHGSLYQTQADYINKYGTTPGRGGGGAGVDYSEHALGEVWIDEDSGLRMIQTTHGPKLAPVGVQPQTARTTAPNANMANQSTYDALQRQMFQLQNESAYEREANIKAQKANVPFSRSDEMTQIQKQMDALNKPAVTQDQDQASGAGQTKMPPQKFGSEQDARNAGYQAGDTIQLFDPGTKTYRPYLLH